MIKKGGLGKGLDALIPSKKEEGTPFEELTPGGIVELDITKIEPNQKQPRRFFQETALQELAQSVKQHGIIQPIIVKQEEGGQFYTIIAGERRFRAAKIAKLPTIPALIKEYTDLETLEIALIENLQRSDLNVIEEGLCYNRLIEEYNLTHDEIADKINKSRSSVTNCLRLLNIDTRVRPFIIDGSISPGHGKVLLSIEDKDLQFEVAEEIMEKGMSVRETEKYIKELKESKEKAPKEKTAFKEYTAIQKDLETIFGTKTRIKERLGKGKGTIEISYENAEELDRLYLMLKSL